MRNGKNIEQQDSCRFLCVRPKWKKNYLVLVLHFVELFSLHFWMDLCINLYLFFRDNRKSFLHWIFGIQMVNSGAMLIITQTSWVISFGEPISSRNSGVVLNPRVVLTWGLL